MGNFENEVEESSVVLCSLRQRTRRLLSSSKDTYLLSYATLPIKREDEVLDSDHLGICFL